MVNVSSGGRVSDAEAKHAEPRIVALVRQDQSKRTGVAYQGDDVDSLFLRSPGPQFSKGDGAYIGWDPGVHLEFMEGISPALDPTNPIHRAFIAEVDKIIASNHPDVVQYNIRKLTEKDPAKPMRRWDSMTAKAIAIAVGADLDEEDHDNNVGIVKACAAYELANLNRKDVLAALDGLLAVEAHASDAFDVEVKLS